MANPRDYPITCPFGWVKDYPLNRTDPSRPNYGFHNGIDYGYPYGTPVIVNGTQIGLSGDTGAPGQPHCHVGKWLGGKVQDPGEYNGFSFDSAVVTEIHTTDDSVNGKYVRIQGDGYSWVYLHLSETSVQANQVLEGEDMGRIQELEKLAEDRLANTKQIAAAVSVNYRDGNDLPQVLANIHAEQNRIDELTRIVSTSDTDASAKLEQIKAILSK